MLNTIRSLVLICLLMPSLGSVWAQKIYQCKDADGHVITSDRPIPECEKLPMKELGRDGVYRREIAAPPTPEEIRQRAADEEKKRIEAAAQIKQQRSDAALLMAYRNEQDIELSRQRALKQIQIDIAISKGRSEQSQREIQKLQSEAASFGSRPVPKHIEQRLTQLQSTLKVETGLQTELDRQVKKSNQKYDADLARFREIRGTGATAAPAMPATSR